MASPVIVKFQVEGVQQVQAAFRSVEQAVVRAENVRVHAAKTSADAEIREKARALHSMNQMAMRANALADKLVEQEASKRGKADKKAADDKIREAKRASDAQSRILDEFESKQQRILDKEKRDYENKEREKTRVAKRELEKRGSDEESVRRRYARAIGYGLSGGIAGGMHAMSRAATQTISGFLDVGGGFSLSGAVQKRLDLEREARAIAIESYVPNGDPSQKIRRNPNDIVQFARTTGIAYNSDVGDVAKAMHAYVEKTSDYEGAKTNMPFIAQVAKVTGTTVSQTAGLMAQVIAQNKDLRGDAGAEAAQRVMLDTINQGRTGSVSYASLAKVSPAITKNAGYFSATGKMTQEQYQDQLMGLAQIGIRMNKAASPTATAISNMVQAAQLGASNIYGKDVKKHTDERGLLTDNVADLMAQMFMTSNGRPDIWKASRKQGGFQLSNFGMTIPQALEPVYAKAIAKAKTDGLRGDAITKAGGDAVRDEVNKSVKAGYGMDDLKKEFKIATDSPAERMDQLMRKLNDSLADKLLPSLERLMPEFEKMIPLFSRLAEQGVPAILDFIMAVTKFVDAHRGLVDDIIAHPIASIFAAKLSESLGKAMLAEIIRDAFQKAATKAGGGGGTFLKVATAAVTAGAMTVALVKPVIDDALEGQKAGQFAAGEIERDLKRGTPAEKAAALAKVEKARELVNNSRPGPLAPFKLLFDTVYSGVTGEKNESVDAIKKAFKASEIIDSEGIKKAIRTAIEQGTADAHGHAVTDPNHPVRKLPTKEPLRGGT